MGSPRLHRQVAAPCLAMAMAISLASLTGCGAPGQVAAPAAPTPTPYAGPLYLAPAERTNDAEQMAGAAGRVVQCTTDAIGGIGLDVYEGAAMPSPEGALEAAAGEVGYIGTAADFVREAADDSRVLYVQRVDGQIKQAMVVLLGPTLDRGKTGWHAETWARCDWSEFPDAVLAAYGFDRWTDRDGRPVPTYELSSGPGPEHCDWQSGTFLHLDGRTYIGNAPAELIPDYVPDTYARSVAVPADATDTGYLRDGAPLWLAADRQAVYLGSPTDAERWPATVAEALCA